MATDNTLWRRFPWTASTFVAVSRLITAFALSLYSTSPLLSIPPLSLRKRAPLPLQQHRVFGESVFSSLSSLGSASSQKMSSSLSSLGNSALPGNSSSGEVSSSSSLLGNLSSLGNSSSLRNLSSGKMSSTLRLRRGIRRGTCLRFLWGIRLRQWGNCLRNSSSSSSGMFHPPRGHNVILNDLNGWMLVSNWYYLGLFWDAIQQRQVSLFDMGDLMVEFWQGVGFWLEHPHFMDLYGIMISQLIMEGDDHQHLGIQQPISSIINWWLSLSHPFEDLRRKNPGRLKGDIHQEFNQ